MDVMTFIKYDEVKRGRIKITRACVNIAAEMHLKFAMAVISDSFWYASPFKEKYAAAYETLRAAAHVRRMRLHPVRVLRCHL